MTTSNTDSPLYIDDIAILSPLGNSGPATFAAFSASISGFKEDLFVTGRYEKIKSAAVPADTLEPLNEALAASGLTSRQRRLLRLCSAPFAAMADSDGQLNTPVLLVVAPEVIQAQNDFSEKAHGYLAKQASIQFNAAHNKVLAYGRAGVFQALAEAQQLLAQGCKEVIIGAADTFFDTRWLAKQSTEQRVASGSAMHAFIPGEAAVFFRVSGVKSPSAIQLATPGRALEKAHIGSDEPCLGDGLDSAWKQALQGLAGNKIEALFSTLNGEAYWARELGVAFMRNSAHFKQDYNHLHPADCLGDTGAAAGAVNIALACLGLRGKQYQGPILVSGSSDHTQRGAVVIIK